MSFWNIFLFSSFSEKPFLEMGTIFNFGFPVFLTPITRDTPEDRV